MALRGLCGHRVPWQPLFWIRDGQCLPPFSGCFSTVLDRVIIPVPHSTSHSDQGPQAETEQSATADREQETGISTWSWSAKRCWALLIQTDTLLWFCTLKAPGDKINKKRKFKITPQNNHSFPPVIGHPNILPVRGISYVRKNMDLGCSRLKCRGKNLDLWERKKRENFEHYMKTFKSVHSYSSNITKMTKSQRMIMAEAWWRWEMQTDFSRTRSRKETIWKI
jgi:hypothetical protein